VVSTELPPVTEAMAPTPVAQRWYALLRVGAGAIVVLEFAFATLGAAGQQWTVPALVIIQFAVVVTAGVWLTVIDLRAKLLPNAIVYPLAGVIGAGSIAIAVAAHDSSRFWWSLAGAAGMWLIYLALALVGGAGGGDLKLAAVLGAWLGTWGWEPVLAGTVLAYVIAMPHTLVILVRTRSMKQTIAFGPYLLAGAIAAATIHLITVTH
jgi:leader peptidase (prepilin peptidase)/N-methyltransferase